MKSFTFFAICLILFLIYTAPGQDSTFLAENYNKAEYRIPMRDGVKLYTTVYTPKNTAQKYPVLIWRTPYSVGPYGLAKYPVRRTESWRHLAEEKFIFVFQDVRGRFMSEGQYVNMRPCAEKTAGETDESTDTYDTIEWLIKNLRHHNGNVGIWGISYPGFYAAMGAMCGHPALAAVSPQAPIADWFIGDDFHHNGAFSLSLGFRFFSVFGVVRPSLITEWPPKFDFGTPDGYRFYLDMGPLANANKLYLHGRIPFWNDLMDHGTYDGFWQERNILNHLHDIRVPVLTVGGWFDAENCYGALNTYRVIEEKNPDTENILVMGPWYHGGWVRSDGSHLGKIGFGSETGSYYKQNIELPFFKHHLKGSADHALPDAFMFETGQNRWHQFDQWPPDETDSLNMYLDSDGLLSRENPVDPDPELSDHFVSDPAKPVPYTSSITTSIPKSYMVEDQRFAATRPDVLVYQTLPLKSDLTVAGPVGVELYVSTDGTDADLVVKLIDVFPDDTPGNDYEPVMHPMGGYQMLLRGDIMRAKFRDDFRSSQPMIPDSVTIVRFSMNDVFHTFKKGHRLMVQIQSSWFPLFDRNPQQFTDIYSAGENDFKKATHRVYRSSIYASHLRLMVLK